MLNESTEIRSANQTKSDYLDTMHSINAMQIKQINA